MADKKELTVFRGQKSWRPPQEAGEYEIRVISRPQVVNLTQVDNTGTVLSTAITCREGDQRTPLHNITQDTVVDSLDVRMSQRADFAIVRPLDSDSVTLDLRWAQGELPLTLTSDFFSDNEPIEILAGTWRVEQSSTATLLPAIDLIDDASDMASMVIIEVPAGVFLRSGLADGEHDIKALMTKEELTKTLCTNLASGVAGVVNDYDLIRDFIDGEKFYLKTYNGKHYVVLKGLGRARKKIRGNWYSLNNPKVVSLSVVQGPKEGTKAAWHAVSAKSALKGNVISMVLVGAIDIVAWHKGVLGDNGEFLSSVVVEICSDAVKGVIGTVIAGFAIGLACAGLGLSVAALPVVLVVGAGIILGVVIGFGLDLLDAKIGVTESIREGANEGEAAAREAVPRLAREIPLAIKKAFREDVVDRVHDAFSELNRAILHCYLSSGSSSSALMGRGGFP